MNDEDRAPGAPDRRPDPAKPKPGTGGRLRAWAVPHPDAVTELVGDAPAPALAPAPARVLVWNVYKGKRRSFAPQFERLVNGRDLVLAQELYFGPQTQALLDASPHQWATATSFTYPRRGGVGTGLGTAARAISTHVEALLSAGREPITRTPKLALMTKYRYGHHELLVANVHAINFAGYQNFVAQLDHVEDALRDHDGPMLLAGDFNTWTTRRLRRLLDMTRAGALEPVEFPGDPRRMALDHAFVRGLEVGSAEVQPSRASDHAALSFEIRPAAADPADT